MSLPPLPLFIAAVHFAAERHRDQRRKGSDASPYINHPIAVAAVLANEGTVADPAVLCAAVLHDILEDTPTQAEELSTHFGPDIAAIVVEVTDDKGLDKARRKTLQIEQAASLSPGAKLVRLADKICNLRDLRDRPPVDWTAARKAAYVRWATGVVDGIRGIHPPLEDCFDTLAGSLSIPAQDAGAHEH